MNTAGAMFIGLIPWERCPFYGLDSLSPRTPARINSHMIISTRDRFSDFQSVTVSALGAEVIDLGPSPTLQDIGCGRALVAEICSHMDADAVGAATVTFSLESDSSPDLATSPTLHAQSRAVPVADIVAGFKINLALPPGRAYERYLGLRYTVDTGPLTASAFSAHLRS